jgi:Putative zinc-finger
MKCLSREELFHYAERLLDDAHAAQVKEHVEGCPSCRAIVREYQQVDSLLEDWKSIEPSGRFDARLRQAPAQAASCRPFWANRWVRVLAPALVAFMLISAAVYFRPAGPHKTAPVIAQKPLPLSPAQIPTPVKASPPVEAQSHLVPNANPKVHRKALPEPGFQSEGQEANASMSEEDSNSDDYEMLANFEVLSELAEGDKKVAN